MKQVLQDRLGGTVVRDVPPPPCEPGSLLVRNAFSAISSGTERARVTLSKKSMLAKVRERPDLARQVVERARTEGVRATRDAVRRKLEEAVAVGYSSAGEVLEVGGSVAGFDVGEVVACAGGGHANHAEIVSVPANLCAKVPAAVPLETASLSAIASIALHAIRLGSGGVGDKVVVVGCGLVGQIALRLLAAAGAETIAVDVDPSRVELALAAGADAAFVVDEHVGERVLGATGNQGVDVALVAAAAGSNAPLVLAAEVARDRAAIVLVGDVPIDVPRALFYEKELSLRVSRSYGPGRYDRAYEEQGLDYPIGYVRWTEKRNMEAILALQAAGRVDLRDLVEEVVPVEDTARAYERLAGPPELRPRGALLIAYGRTDGVPSEPIRLGGAAPAAHGRPTPARRTPVRIGLIGPGSFASRILVPAFARADARLAVVAGGSGPSAEAAQRQLGFERLASGAEAVIGDEDVDAVVIATPHAAHATLVVQALEAGKHVFCEKPLALTHEELESVLEAAAAGAGVLAVGFNRRFSPLLRRLRDFLCEGGERTAASYRVSAGRLDPTHWAHHLDEGGGRVLGEVCHFVDSLAFLADAEVETVYAAGYGAAQLPLQARDSVAVNLTLADGSVGAILYVADGAGRVAKERLEGFSGDRTGILDDYRALELFGGPDGRRRIRARRQGKGHEQEVAAFLAGIERGEHPVALEAVGNTSMATLAIVESLRTGRPVRVR
jgi:predicted dehydrogenase